MKHSRKQTLQHTLGLHSNMLLSSTKMVLLKTRSIRSGERDTPTSDVELI